MTHMATREVEQPAFEGLSVPASRSRAKKPTDVEAALVDPVARVCVLVAPAHLDQSFDYLVTEKQSADAQSGVRVKVPFGGQDVDGYIIERVATSDHGSELRPLRRVVSPEVVVPPGVFTLARRVADRYCGTLADVLRFAVVPRHAGEEDNDPPVATVERTRTWSRARTPEAIWADYAGGPHLLTHLAAGQPTRAVWTALPGQIEDATPRWTDALVALAQTADLSGRGCLLLVPEVDDLDRLESELLAAGLTRWNGSSGDYARLHANDGPRERYRQYLACVRGHVRIVIGGRSAAYTPVADLAVIAVWDDSHESYREQHAPFPATREVCIQRTAIEGCSLLIGGLTRTVEAQQLVATGWAIDVSATRERVRAIGPIVHALTSEALASEGPAAAARLPSKVWRAVKETSEVAPVLIQVPRSGYVPVLGCSECGRGARCRTCSGPMELPAGSGSPTCQWCGKVDPGWRCQHCKSGQLRSVRVGSERTAEELGRAFPGLPIIMSGTRVTGGVQSIISRRPCIVVATPGAEPVVPGGYGLIVLLDAAVTSAYMNLDSAQRALRTWLNAGALAADRRDGATVLLVGDGDPLPTDALVRWDPAGFARRELEQRARLQLPPSVRAISVTGDAASVDELLRHAELPGSAEVLGPVDVPGSGNDQGTALIHDQRVVIRAPLSEGQQLCRAIGAAIRTSSAHRRVAPAKVMVDPRELI